jgi:hypothetical protein
MVRFSDHDCTTFGVVSVLVLIEKLILIGIHTNTEFEKNNPLMTLKKLFKILVCFWLG